MFRRTLFWLHLIVGIVAGLIIALLCFTGAALAFEKELVAWAERDVRRVEVPAGGHALPADEIIAKAQAAKPGTPVGGVTFLKDPGAAVAVSFGRDEVFYVNPYTGEVKQPSSQKMHDFMHLMVEWHRWLALSDENRDTGKAITGAANLVFLFLGLSGLYLWFPRSLRWPSGASWRFIGAKGKARDWNWHNVIGFWSLPVLIILTASGAVIGYRWASDLVYKAAGEEAPARQGPGQGGGPGAGGAQGAGQPKVEKPFADAKALPFATLLKQAQDREPTHTEITLRTRPQGRGGQGQGPGQGQGGGSRDVPYTFQVRTPEDWPAFATTTYSVNPYTGAVLRTERFEDQTKGRQWRMWLRFLHTGEALRWPGQLIAGLACVGGLVLVYTGFALTWRRFRRT